MVLQTLVDGLGEDATLALGAVLIGVLFGFMAQRSRFCLRSAVNEFVRNPLGGKRSAWLITFATVVGVTQALAWAGLFEASHARQSAARGSLSGAALLGEPKLEGIQSGVSMRRYVVGAVCMGFGGMLAGGCAVGAGLSGAAVFTATAWVALRAMWAAALTDRLLDQHAHGALDQAVPGINPGTITPDTATAAWPFLAPTLLIRSRTPPRLLASLVAR